MAETATEKTVKKSFVPTPYKADYKSNLSEPDEVVQDSTQQTDPAPAATQDADANLPPEEKTYKQRYADLRRREQKLLDEKKRLETQLAEAATKPLRLPKTKEELDRFRAEQPDTYEMIKTISVMTAEERAEELKKKIDELEEAKLKAARDAAEQQLLNRHPDFEQIRESDEFHDWASKQPKNIQDALYDNFDDPLAAARAIDLYKLDTGLLKPNKNKKEQAKEAAQAVSTSVRPEPDAPKGKIWKESEIRKLNTKQFMEVEKELDAALREGRIEYDLTGR